jgi:hypothetical protein
MYSPQRHFPLSSSTAVLEESPAPVDEEELELTDRGSPHPQGTKAGGVVHKTTL